MGRSLAFALALTLACRAAAEDSAPQRHKLTFNPSVAVTVTGGGSVSSSPPGITCTAGAPTCASQFSPPVQVVLSASAFSGNVFLGWSGACSGSSATCTVDLPDFNIVKNVGAGFGAAPAVLAASPASIDFGALPVNVPALRAVTVSNTGTGTLTVGAVQATAGFSASGSCGALGAGQSCTIAVGFVSSVVGAATGTLTIPSSAGTATVALRAEAEHSLVSHYYASILRRAPDPSGKAFWHAESVRLTRLGIDLKEAWYALAMNFFNSPEYRAFNRDDAGYVRDLYRTFFAREPDAGGQAYWVSQVAAGMPREAVLVAFMLSPEFVSFTRSVFGPRSSSPEVDIVVDFYRGLLGRAPDDGGFEYWLRRFRLAQCAGAQAVYAEVEAISASFQQSGEYAARGRGNADYVADLYNAFLRRGGDLEGVRFWIGRLEAGETRANLRRLFLASPEFSARVRAMIDAGCLTLTEGAFDYQGPPVPLGRVRYVTRAGRLLVSPASRVGWVTLHVDAATPASTVATAVAQAGGAIVAQQPRLGSYFVETAPGNERAFLAAIYGNSWVREGGPVTPSVRGANRVIDGNGRPPDAPCDAYHGSIVEAIANRRGGGFALEDLGPSADSHRLADVLLRRIQSVPPGQRQVLNLSWNVDKGPLEDLVTAECDLACVTGDIAHDQYLLLDALLQAMQEAWEEDPGVANRTLVTIILGNPKVGLDAELARLKTDWPQAFARSLLVGGVDSAGQTRDGAGKPYFNHSTDPDVVFARGVDVPSPIAAVAGTCTGTSYAGPEVASVADAVWRANPGLTSDAIVNAVRFAAAPTRVLPQGPDGFTTQAFIDSARIASLGFTLTVVKLGSGEGTLTPSPVGPVHRAGSTVLVLAVASGGSTFAGWGGACSGTSGCVVTMDADKTVYGSFEAIPCSISVSTTTPSFMASGGSGSISVSAGPGCAWTATSDASWLAFTSSISGSGPGTVFFTVQANVLSTARTANVSIGGKTLAITQAGQGSSPTFACSTRRCDYACNCTGELSTTCLVYPSPGAAPRQAVPLGGQCGINPCEPGLICQGVPQGGVGQPTCKTSCP